MADTVASVGSLVRFIADDQEISWLDDAVQLASINMGWREFQRRLAMTGSGLLQDTALITIPATTTVLNADTVIPPPSGNLPDVHLLPSDFMMPYLIAERPAGSSEQFIPMLEQGWDATNPTNFLRVWKWEGGSIKFIGATSDIEIRLTYARSMPALITPDQEIPFPWAIDAIAWAVLYTVALARGASEAYRQECSAKCDQQLQIMASFHTKRDQYKRMHRAPYMRGRF